MTAERTADVLIVGGGPAGSTAAILLAEAGIAASVVEAAAFPRFHVGESLLPHTLPLLDRLGVGDAVAALPHTRRKEGASFFTPEGDRHVAYWFDEAEPPALSHSYQVRRDEFDEVLLERARSSGAELLSGWRAVAPVWEGNRLAGARLHDPDGYETTVRSRVLLDATGQSAFVANKMGWRFPYPKHRRLAVFGHFRGVEPLHGREGGNISIILTGGGWIWVIPFNGGTSSVGVVVDLARRAGRESSAELFQRIVAGTPEAARRLAPSEPREPVASCQSFSYRVMHMAGDGYCLLGDAAGFLDPVFSSGVFIATTTAASAAQDVVEGFARHSRLEANDFAPTVTLTRSLQRLFFSLVRSYYNPDFRAFLLSPHSAMGIPAAVVSLLAGDVLGRGRWRRVARYRTLVGLSVLQGLGTRWGRPLVEPVP